MTRFEEFKNMDIEALVEWIYEHGEFDGSPWCEWFDENYCSKCESVICKTEEVLDKLGFEPFYEKDVECAYCEIYKKCKYFLDWDEQPDSKDIVRLWLESDIDAENINC